MRLRWKKNEKSRENYFQGRSGMLKNGADRRTVKRAYRLMRKSGRENTLYNMEAKEIIPADIEELEEEVGDETGWTEGMKEEKEKVEEDAVAVEVTMEEKEEKEEKEEMDKENEEESEKVTTGRQVNAKGDSPGLRRAKSMRGNVNFIKMMFSRIEERKEEQGRGRQEGRKKEDGRNQESREMDRTEERENKTPQQDQRVRVAVIEQPEISQQNQRVRMAGIEQPGMKNTQRKEDQFPRKKAMKQKERWKEGSIRERSKEGSNIQEMFEKMRKKNEAEARGSKEKSWKAVEGTTPRKAGRIRKEGGMSMEGRKADRVREAGNMEKEDLGKQGRKRKAEEECSTEKGRIGKKVAAEKEDSIRRYLVGSREFMPNFAPKMFSTRLKVSSSLYTLL